jgi:hypothetical protein
MRRFHIVSTVVVLLVSVLVSACGQKTPDEPLFEDSSSEKFSIPTNVNNEWFPLRPGTRFVYTGYTVENGEQVSHRVELAVTDLTKVIAGVRNIVVWELDYSADVLVEAELVFYAQADGGTVWSLGQYPEEYENGRIIDNPTWIHGLLEAKAGIVMPAKPQVGTPGYSQGWGPDVDYTDRGQVSQVGQHVCVPVDCYQDVLVIDETSALEPGAHQLKYYARDVGVIRVDWKGEDQTQETLELVEISQLNPEALAQVRVSAVELEKSAYENSRDVYIYTSPVEYPEGTPAITVTIVPAPSSQASATQGSLTEVIIYASDLLESDLSELEFWESPESPGDKMIGLLNNGDELDPPPENDPHVIFHVQVQSGIPYRCWIHMKVGKLNGKSTANLIWIQFSDAVDEVNNELFKPGTASSLRAQGSTKEGWSWVECDRADSEAEPLVYFKINGEIIVRLQAGMEGVGFDQFVLSAKEYLEGPPTAPIVEK